MLKLLYKTLLISTMSCSLMTMNMTAFATEKTRDANGVVTIKETQKLESVNQENIKSSQTWIDGITMLAIGVVGSRLLMYKKWTFDMQLAAIGSAAYLGSEVITLMNYSDAVGEKKQEIIKKNDGSTNQTQLDSLNDLKSSYQKTIGSLKTKKFFQEAAAVAFGAAGLYAGYQLLVQNSQHHACTAAIDTALAPLGTCAAETATGAGATEAAACAACIKDITKLKIGIIVDEAFAQVPGWYSNVKAAKALPKQAETKVEIIKPCNGVTAESIKTASVVPVCATYYTTMIRNQGYGLTDNFSSYNNPLNNVEKLIFANASSRVQNPQISYDPSLNLRKILELSLDSFFPKAEAGWTGLLGLGAGAAAVFLVFKKTLSTLLDKIMFHPGLRIAAWGVMASVATGASASTQKEINQAEENIKKIDTILTDLQTLKNGIKAQNIQNQHIQLSAFSVNQSQNAVGGSGPTVRTDCLSGSGDQNCPPLSDNYQSMPGFSGLPDSFKSIVSQTTKLGNSLGGKTSLSGDTLAKDLGSNLGAIGKLKASLRSKINDALSREGKPRIDFDKNEKNLWADMNAQTSKVLAANHMSPGAFLAGTGISPISNAEAAVPKMPSQNTKAIVGGSDAGGAGGAAKDKGLDLDFKEAKESKDSNEALGAQGAVIGDGAHKAEQFDIGSNDITTNSSESIFSVISNRYLKSGYPKLLEEIPAKK